MKARQFFAIAAFVAISFATTQAHAQSGGRGFPMESPGMAPQGMPPQMGPPMQGMPPQMGPPPMDMQPGVGYGDPSAMYGGECDACDAYGNSIPAGAGGGFGPGAYGVGGGYDQSGPHYWDFTADFLYWKRDRSASPAFATTSLGVDGPRVLSTSSAGLDYQPGFRLAGRLDLGPVSLVEAIYFGTVNHDSRATVTGNSNLFSVFSNFGNGALTLEADNADSHSIRYQSELNNAEINYRVYWVSDNPRLTGTFLTGARYTRLTEAFTFNSVVNPPTPAFLDYNVKTENDLVGFQIGADAAYTVSQGLRVVTEAKVGIFNNRTVVNSRISATTINPARAETTNGNNVAFLGEGRIMVVADILPNISIRAGYELLFLNSVALAGNNFNTAIPGTIGNRTPFLADQGEAFYHGLNAGIEYVW